MAEDGIGPQVHPITHPASVRWGLAIKHADYNKILKGFQPQDMDDKWLCVADKPDAQGNTVLHAYRSWTGKEQVSLSIAAGNGNEGAKIDKLSWESEQYSSEEEAKELAVNICKRLLGCDLDNAS